MLLTMVIVSLAVFAITEAAPGNVARNVLGIHITPEQEASFLAQTGLDKPLYERYIYWLIGSDWRAAAVVGLPMRQIKTEDGFTEWWAVAQDGTLTQWKLEGEGLIARRRQPGSGVNEATDNGRWLVKDPAIEVKRLEAYRDTLLENAQLAASDRQAIVRELDVILSILRDKNQTQETLTAALAEPEQALEAMLDPDAGRKKEGLQKAASEITKNDKLVQAVAAHQRLISKELAASDLKSIARQLNQASQATQDVNPALAGQLAQAAANLDAGDTDAAEELLNNTMPAINQLTGSLANCILALQASDYKQAVGVLQDLSDPAKMPLDAAALAILPGTLEEIADALESTSPDLSQELLQAAQDLEAGDTEAARLAVGQAANLLGETTQAIVRSEAASSARVVRTFWGIDTQNHAVQWEKGAGKITWVLVAGSGWMARTGGPAEYIPLQKGLLRGDPGVSLRTGRPVADLLFTRLRNSLILAGTAFVIVMPLALLLGMIAGLNEGKWLDRTLSIGGMMFSVTPEFATGIFLILIFASWLKLVPGATVFGEKAPWSRPDMLVLPVLTLTLVELGYVLRITRASMVEVMKAPYIRTAFLKGLPYWHVVFKHAVRNALMAPITVIMLHVNWLLGGIVVVEVIFGYPGLGSYLLDSALFKDFNAIEAGAIILVAVAVGTQLLADIIYTFLNPRIRYG